MSFSYKLLNDNTRQFYEAMLQQELVKFDAWRARSPNRAAQPLERAFKSYWLQAGKTGFKATEDSMRFRSEVLDTLTVREAVRA